MILIKRHHQLVLFFNPANDRYCITKYNGQVIDESNNRATIDVRWRQETAQ